MNDKPWEKIFEKYRIYEHDFDLSPYLLSAEMIKSATAGLSKTNEREVRILCKQDYREARPQIFQELGLFLLPIKNGEYAILKGEGYVDIPPIEGPPGTYAPKLSFPLDTCKVGNSEMQHLDFAYAVSLIKTLLEDETLILTIRGRKYTPKFSFRVGSHQLTVEGVQTEVDAGYEGKHQVVLVEAKNSKTHNVIIRQIFYPFRQWSCFTTKRIRTIFFEKREKEYSFWHFEFRDPDDYNSIYLYKAEKYVVII